MKMRIKKKEIILLSVLGAVVLVTLWVLYGRSEGGAQLTDIFSGGGNSTIETQKLPSAQIFDESLEKDERFRELKDDRDFTINTKAKGRKNPFEQVK